MRIFFGFIVLLFSSSLHAQTETTSTAENMVCSHLFGNYSDDDSQKKVRAVLKQKDTFFSKINPLRYTASGLMFVYQNVFSEQISSSCVYEVSCSEMTKKSIEYHGLIKGTFIGLHQLTNCSNNILHDHESFERSDDDKVINSVSKND
jgi:putative component of membrane protein insertase Oxa1/YidC/SpoIIIJ protein YidD